MSKLYPPYIEGTIPAFSVKAGDSSVMLEVPFSLNRAVSIAEISGFALQIKTVSTNQLIASVTQENSLYFSFLDNPLVTFKLPASFFHIGQYYKLQLAFINRQREIGYFSTVGVIKCTSHPLVEIEGLINGRENNYIYTYTGIFSQAKGLSTTVDYSEKLYSSEFILYDINNNIKTRSGVILHNTTADASSDMANENYTFTIDLPQNETFFLQYETTSVNGLKVKSPRYKVSQRNSLAPDLPVTLETKVDRDDGYIDIFFRRKRGLVDSELFLSGLFVLSRAEETKPDEWTEITTFSFQNEPASRHLWRDFNVEQGIKYIYSIQRKSGLTGFAASILSNRILSQPVKSEFEDAFLSDDTHQLKIHFNPSIGTFKVSVSDNKNETIGGKYPFITRNGAIGYHELSIGGLISYLMDDKQLFLSKDSIKVEYDSSELTQDNMVSERLFKTQVYDWLNNGQLKLFRSPAEGNFIVRLTDVSLTPENGIGRMLHSFNCSACEMCDYSYLESQKKKLIFIQQNINFIDEVLQQELEGSIQTVPKKYIKKLETWQLFGHDSALDELLEVIPKYIDASISLEIAPDKYSRIVNANFRLKDYFYFNKDTGNYVLMTKEENQILPLITSSFTNIIGKPTYLGGFNEKGDPISLNGGSLIFSIDITNASPGIQFNLDDNSFIITKTGNFSAQFPEGVESFSIETLGNFGTVTLGIMDESAQAFTPIAKTITCDEPCQQFIGAQSKTIKEITGIDKVTDNIIDMIENCKTEIISIQRLAFYRRPIEIIYQKNGANYMDMECTTPYSNYNPLSVYAICRPKESYKYEEALFAQYIVDAFLKEGYYLTDKGTTIPIFTGGYLDGRALSGQMPPKNLIYTTDITIDNSTISLGNKNEYVIQPNSNNIKQITLGNLVYCEITYKYKEIEYMVESTNAKIKALKQQVEITEGYLNAARANVSAFNEASDSTLFKDYDNKIKRFQQEYIKNYDTLIYQLDLILAIS